MGLKNCPECGKLFVSGTVPMCPACYEQEEKDEMKIVEYLREKNKASMEEIHEATGVKERTIFRMIKAGRFMGISDISYPCEVCGTLIFGGRMCDKCNTDFLKQVKESKLDRAAKVQIESDKNRGAGMHSRDRGRYR